MNVWGRAVVVGGRYMAAMLLMLVAPSVLAQPFERGVFWRIEKAGTPASYVLGTIHAYDPRVAGVRPGVRRALQSVDVVATELRMELEEMQQAMLAMFLPPDRNLSALLGKPDFDRLVAVLGTSGLPGEALDRMKPFAAYTLLVMPPRADVQPLDMAIYMEGKEAGKQMVGLETAEEQMRVLDRIGEATMASELKSALRSLPILRAFIDKMIGLYGSEELAGLYAISTQPAPWPGSSAKFAQSIRDNLLDGRNQIMVDRARAYLAKRSVLIAIGAAHLPGERGVLTLLARDGYKVTRVSLD